MQATAHSRDLIILIKGISAKDTVVANKITGKQLAEFNSHEELKLNGEGWMYENNNLWIRPGNGSRGSIVYVKGITNL